MGGSTAHRQLNQRLAKLHQQIARQRQQWHFELAGELVDKAEVIFVENLKVSQMAKRNQPKQDEKENDLPNGQGAKSGLNKSFADAGIAGFLNEILPYKAARARRLVVKVNPAGTSQDCATCLNRVPQELKDRWHECACGASMPRDLNALWRPASLTLHGACPLSEVKGSANPDRFYLRLQVGITR